MENINYDNEGLINIARCWRISKVINILQTVYLIGNITASNVLRITNTPDNNITFDILQCSINKNINDTLNYVTNSH